MAQTCPSHLPLISPWNRLMLSHNQVHFGYQESLWTINYWGSSSLTSIPHHLNCLDPPPELHLEASWSIANPPRLAVIEGGRVPGSRELSFAAEWECLCTLHLLPCSRPQSIQNINWGWQGEPELMLPEESCALSPVPVCCSGRKEAGRAAQMYFSEALNLCSENGKVKMSSLWNKGETGQNISVSKKIFVGFQHSCSMGNIGRQKHAGLKDLWMLI